MNNKTAFKRQIQKFAKLFAEKHNFTLYRRTFLIKRQSDLLHIVCFDFPPSGVRCHIAVQPLYVPASDINFCAGERLNYFYTSKTGLWGQEESQFENDIQEISDLLEANVIPWFGKIVDETAFIKCLGKKEPLRIDPYFKAIFLGFSYLKLKEYETAKISLKTAIKLSAERIGSAAVSMADLLDFMANAVDSKNYKAIDDKLIRITEKTMLDCGIDILGTM